ncbi:histidinol dehydrogenase [Thermomonas sp.]|jgi:histidinol dehydrogenase|uniref:histidinol dehydrogenase n=1 Tax=Thermomonas sp. TaxID=1971895 RepID=UPI001ACFF553|nr:histidinol dehydrogenase [Xanthomonadales bacterium]MBN8795142.1 histidinol dehydrogenase [Stenotrophomonas nitritireducens]
MKCIDWNQLDDAAREAVLQRPVQAVSDTVRSGVRAVFDAVAARGDEALRDFTARFDGVALEEFEVGADEFARAAEAVPAEVQAAIAEAASRIEAFHRAGIARPYEVETAPGLTCQRVQRPIRRVGLYVPAGSAPLPSTALMLCVPARLAGCAEVVLCTPPRADGSADPAVLLAARQAPGVRVFKLGGAQAIAAMALGTARVPRCDKLFGPGNAWVDEAKRQAAQRPGGVAIDMPAGPSEVLVIADGGANPAFVAADLLSQAEHGPDSQVLLLTDSTALLEAVAAEVEAQLATLPRADIARRALEASRLVRVRDIAQAIAISNVYAPEHLILSVREPRAWLDRIGSAGSIFLGDWTPEALGDYCSGSNHVLPTGGAARAWSGLSVASFQKAITVQEATRAGIASAGPCAAILAHAEGLQAHARAVELRLEHAA